jgi:hypothetical protein
VVSLDPGVGAKSEMLNVLAQQTLSDGVDVSIGMLLFFSSTGRQGIITSTTNMNYDALILSNRGLQRLYYC